MHFAFPGRSVHRYGDCVFCGDGRGREVRAYGDTVPLQACIRHGKVAYLVMVPVTACTPGMGNTTTVALSSYGFFGLRGRPAFPLLQISAKSRVVMTRMTVLFGEGANMSCGQAGA